MTNSITATSSKNEVALALVTKRVCEVADFIYEVTELQRAALDYTQNQLEDETGTLYSHDEILAARVLLAADVDICDIHDRAVR